MKATMSTARRRAFDSWHVFCGTATLAFALMGASTALTIVDAATLNLTVKSWGAISISAAFTSCFALLFIIVLTICRLGCSGKKFHKWCLPWLGALVTIVAAGVFSINALVLKAINVEEVKRVQHGRLDVTWQFVLWAVAIVSQAVFWSLVMLKAVDGTATSPICNEKSAARRPPTPPTLLRMNAPPYAPGEASRPLSPTPSSIANSKRSSWRDSLVSLRPNNIRNKLLSSRTTLSRASSVRSAATAHSDAFDSWDTSHMDMSLKETVSPTVPSRGTTLETIPGSRPASPARALDGPFSPSDVAPTSFPGFKDDPPSTLPQNSFSQQRIKRTFIPVTRAMSPSDGGGDESHIHPLFRTDSPTPPPAVSRDTIVTASPMGGQVMPAPVLPRPASRMRSASQLSCRAVSRGSSRAPSRAGSMDEPPSAGRRARSVDGRWTPNGISVLSTPHLPSNPFITPTVMAESPLVRGAEIGDESRSSSPISRGRTPPIPEFILSAKKEGPRSKSSKETLSIAPSYARS